MNRMCFNIKWRREAADQANDDESFVRFASFLFRIFLFLKMRVAFNYVVHY